MRALFCAAHDANDIDRFFAAACTWQKTLCAERVYAPAACAQSGVRSYSKTATESVAVFEDFLSLFAEVAQTQRCGRLILALLAQRHDDQNDQRDDVGEHLVELLDGKVGAGGLLENKGLVMTRNQILCHVWGYDFDGETRTVDVHVRTLRQKLGEAGNLIETVRGVGYRIGA